MSNIVGRLCRLGCAGAAVALLVVASDPWNGEAEAGTYTVDIGCYAGSSPTAIDPRGWYRATSSRFDSYVGCAVPWGLGDVSPDNDGMRASKNGATWSGVPTDDRLAGWRFLAPGHPFFREDIGPAPHPHPDAAFSSSVAIVSVRVGHLFRRNGDAGYSVGMFANDFAFQSEGILRLRGCSAGTVDGSSASGGPASDCDPATSAGAAFGSFDDIVPMPPTRTVREISWSAWCPGGACSATASSAAYVALSSDLPPRITLREDAGPELTITGGTLGQNGLRRGPQTVTFDVRDIVGVDRVDVVVDGATIAGLDYPGCEPADGAMISTRVPCPLDADRIKRDQAIRVPTDALRDGAHTAIVRAVDALGNVTQQSIFFRSENVPDDLELEIPGVRFGGLESEIVPAAGTHYRTRSSRMSIRRGLVLRMWRTAVSRSDTPVIRGVLRRRKGSIRLDGSSVQLFEERGDEYVPAATLHTNRLGGFRFGAPAGPSRVYSVLFTGDDAHKGALAQVEARSAARITIAASRTTLRNGQILRLHGGLSTRPLIARKIVLLQTIVRGRWRTFKTVRASASGRWASAYRFEATRTTTRYPFRALAPKQTGYPYESGVSRIVRVKVTP